MALKDLDHETKTTMLNNITASLTSAIEYRSKAAAVGAVASMLVILFDIIDRGTEDHELAKELWALSDKVHTKYYEYRSLEG